MRKLRGAFLRGQRPAAGSGGTGGVWSCCRAPLIAVEMGQEVAFVTRWSHCVRYQALCEGSGQGQCSWSAAGVAWEPAFVKHSYIPVREMCPVPGTALRTRSSALAEERLQASFNICCLSERA